MIPALLTLLTTGVGGWIAAAVVPIALAGGIWGAVAWHDSAVRDDLLAQQAVAEAASTITRQQAAMSALSGLIAQRDASARKQASILEDIAHAPVSTDCAHSAAVRDALAGLRRDLPAAGASGDSGGAADTGAGTGTAGGDRD